ncbi:MAG: DEAD/DEAH box helicase [Candidatus Aenigmatarchaeota archaeon]
MAEFVSHRLIRPGTLQARMYQQQILGRAAAENLLVVLPTGLGKTPIAVMLAAHVLDRFPEGKILVLAPTKPLTGQHFQSFQKFMNVEESEFQVVTGEMSPSERTGIYERKRFIFATPQTVRNDIESGKMGLSSFSLLVFDEAHHAIGGYAYPYIAKKYSEQAPGGRILALSASPGASIEKINEICKNLGVSAVDVRGERDSDVSPYVQRKDIERVEVFLPQSFMDVRKLLMDTFERKIAHLRKFGFRKPAHLVGKRDLLALQADFIGKARSGGGASFAAVSIITQCIKLEYALTLLETQGIGQLTEYWKKMGKEATKADKVLCNDAKVKAAMKLTAELAQRGSRHPKVSKLCSIVGSELSEKPASRIIIFANYRASVREIVDALSRVGGARPVRFVGQKEGVTQKDQLKTLRGFRDGEYNVLVATAVGEEGLDIPSANLAIFYEPVPSPLRSIQRRGRVGRADIGKVVMLITQGTRDEGYYWTSQNREKRMKDILRGMKAEGRAGESEGDKDRSLGNFM